MTPPVEPDALVSMVLPTLNGERFIASAVESCLRQTYDRFELIVVDGGSSDGTVETVRRFGDPRIRLIIDAKNVDRLPGALNRGFATARGAYFTWFQDDDLYDPDALATLVRGLTENPAAGMVYTGQVFVDAEGNELRLASELPPEALSWTNPVGHCFLYRRTVAEAVGSYDVRFLMAEDVHYWLRVYRHAPIVRLSSSSYYHRLHPQSLTGRGYGAYEALRVAARARREVLSLSPKEYRRQLAAAWIEEAFAAYERRDFAHVLPGLARGLVRDPRRMARVGVASIGVRSLLRLRQPRTGRT